MANETTKWCCLVRLPHVLLLSVCWCLPASVSWCIMSCLKISLPYRVHTAGKTVTLSRPARLLDELAKHSAQCLDWKGMNFASNFLGLIWFDVSFSDRCHWMSLLPYNGTGLWTGTECVVGALWTVWLLANIFDDGWCRRTFQLTLRVGQWRRMQVLSNVMGSFQCHSSLMLFFYFCQLVSKPLPNRWLQSLTNLCLHSHDSNMSKKMMAWWALSQR